MLELAIDCLAVYRLTRLATTDTITRGGRARIIRFAYELRDGEDDEADVPATVWESQALTDDDAPKLAELVTCRWCAGLWIALAAAVARRRAPRAWAALSWALATGSAAALLSRLE